MNLFSSYHKSFHYKTDVMVNPDATIQLFSNEVRLAVSNFSRMPDHISFLFEHKRIDMTIPQKMPIVNGKVILLGEGYRLHAIEKSKIIEHKKLARQNSVVAIRQIEFGQENGFLSGVDKKTFSRLKFQTDH